MWSQTRTYLKQQIEVISPTRSEWDDSLQADTLNTPSTLLKQRYHIALDPGNSNATSGKVVEDNVFATVTIWSQGYKTVTATLDALMDEALCIRHQIIDQRNMELFGGEIYSIINTAIEPSEIDGTNDNTVQVQLTFNVRFIFPSPIVAP